MGLFWWVWGSAGRGRRAAGGLCWSASCHWNQSPSLLSTKSYRTPWRTKSLANIKGGLGLELPSSEGGRCQQIRSFQSQYSLCDSANLGRRRAIPIALRRIPSITKDKIVHMVIAPCAPAHTSPRRFYHRHFERYKHRRQISGASSRPTSLPKWRWPERGSGVPIPATSACDPGGMRSTVRGPRRLKGTELCEDGDTWSWDLARPRWASAAFRARARRAGSRRVTRVWDVLSVSLCVTGSGCIARGHSRRC